MMQHIFDSLSFSEMKKYQICTVLQQSARLQKNILFKQDHSAENMYCSALYCSLVATRGDYTVKSTTLVHGGYLNEGKD